MGQTLYFAADDGVNGSELWKSDGTEAGTLLVRDIHPEISGVYPGSSPSSLKVLDGVLYFKADDGTHGRELWKSDGTEAGTLRVTDIGPGSGDGVIGGPVVLANALYLMADDGVSGWELWTSDGTEAGTQQLADIAPGAASSYASGLVPLDPLIFFTAADSRGGSCGPCRRARSVPS